MATPTQRLAELAATFAPTAIRLRRDLHMHPEIAWSEFQSTARVGELLSSFGLEPQVRSAGTGLHVDIGEGPPIVGFRADLDALAIQEEGTSPYVSQHTGLMHGCGHDVHTAIATGIAGVLSSLHDLHGAVRVIFQPAEEHIPGGASTLVEEGVHRGLTAILAYHVDPTLAPGRVGIRTGGITSASDRFTVAVHGPGGHTSRPHQTVDLVYAMSKVAVELPTVLARGIDPREPLAVVFGSIEAGSVANVIPTAGHLQGTVRVFDMDLWRSMPKMLETAVNDILAPLGATFEVGYYRGSPPVVNSGAVTALVREAAVAQLGESAVVDTHQSLGSEDFAWFLEDVPGSLIRLGAALPDLEIDLHSSRFDVDEACIETGILVGAASLLELLDDAAARR
jgi:amidohydrolase